MREQERISAEQEKAVAQQSPYPVEFVPIEEMPTRSVPGNEGKGRWEWLRRMLFAMKPGEEPAKVRMPNKREAKLGSSAAQNAAWTLGKTNGTGKHRPGRLPPKTVRVVTATEPVTKGKQDGEFYLWFRLATREPVQE